VKSALLTKGVRKYAALPLCLVFIKSATGCEKRAANEGRPQVRSFTAVLGFHFARLGEMKTKYKTKKSTANPQRIAEDT
jgi:hypothetical protein